LDLWVAVRRSWASRGAVGASDRPCPRCVRFPFPERECRLHGWVAAHGYPAPPLLELLAPGELFDSPFQVMRRVAGTTMDHAITAAPWRSPRLVRQLAASEAALHRLPVPEWAQAGHNWSHVDMRLQLTRYLVAEGLRGPLEEALERTGGGPHRAAVGGV
jgi:Phosphotransferase enzyme family